MAHFAKPRDAKGFPQSMPVKRQPGSQMSRLRLIAKKHKRCKICGCLMSSCIGKDSSATIDHVYSRIDIRRALSNKWIAACYLCNHTRGNDAIREMYKNFDYSKPAFYIDLVTKTIVLCEDIFLPMETIGKTKNFRYEFRPDIPKRKRR